MDARKITFLFGELPPDLDPDDLEVRHRLVRERVFADRPVLDERLAGECARRAAVPVDRRSDCHRLYHRGLADRRPIAGRGTDAELRDGQSVLGLARNSTFVASLGSDGAVDHTEYRRQLERLPHPPVREVVDVLLLLFRERRAVSSGELVKAVLARFSASEGDNEHLERWVDEAVDAVLDHDPSFVLMAPDLVVHVPTILDGAALTHRLTDSERRDDCIDAGADLAVLLRRSDRLQLESGDEVELGHFPDGDGFMIGPAGWLEILMRGRRSPFGSTGTCCRFRRRRSPSHPRLP